MSAEGVDVQHFARVFVDEAGQLPPNADCYKSDRGWYYRLNLQEIPADPAGDLVSKAAEKFDVEVVGQVIEQGQVVKERRYVDSVEEVPEGYLPETGPQGGIYYETNPANDPVEGGGMPTVGDPTTEVGYSGEPVLAVQFEDIEPGDRIAFEQEDGTRDIGEVTDVDVESHIVVVESGDGETEVAAAQFNLEPEQKNDSATHNAVYGGQSLPDECRECGERERQEGSFRCAECDDGVSKAGEDVWVYYVGPQGGEGWQNVQTGEIRYQKRRPGEAPEDGDGKGDWLAEGWAEPPEEENWWMSLQPGQTIEYDDPGGDFDPTDGTVEEVTEDGVLLEDGSESELPPDNVTAVEDDYDPHEELIQVGYSENPEDGDDWAVEHGVTPGESVTVTGGPLGSDSVEMEIVGYNDNGLPAVNGSLLGAEVGIDNMAGNTVGLMPQNIEEVPNDADEPSDIGDWVEPDYEIQPFLEEGDEIAYYDEDDEQYYSDEIADTGETSIETVGGKVLWEDQYDLLMEPDTAAEVQERKEYEESLNQWGVPEDEAAAFREEHGWDIGDEIGYNMHGDVFTGEIVGVGTTMQDNSPNQYMVQFDHMEEGKFTPAQPNSITGPAEEAEPDLPGQEEDDSGDEETDSDPAQEPAEDAVGEEVESPESQSEWTAGVVDDNFSLDDADNWGSLGDFHFPTGVSAQFMRVGETEQYDGSGNQGLVFGNFYGGNDELGIDPASAVDPSKEDLGRRQMTTYHAADALGGNVPTCSTPDGGDTVYVEGVEGENIGAAPQEYLEKVDEDDWYEQAAVQIICGNNDAHMDNVMVTPDGDIVVHDIDHSSGPLDSSFVGAKPYYDDAVDRTLSELYRSAKHVVEGSEEEVKRKMWERAQEKASEVASEEGLHGEDFNERFGEAKKIDYDFASNIRENLIKLATGEVTYE